jgi:hypothetical protein
LAKVKSTARHLKLRLLQWYRRETGLFVDGGWTAIDGPPTGLTQLAK